MTIDSSDPDRTTAGESGRTATELPYGCSRPASEDHVRQADATDYAEYVRAVLTDDDETEITDREYVRTVVRQSRRADPTARPLFSSVVGDRIDEVR